MCVRWRDYLEKQQKTVRIIKEYHFLAFQERCMLSALKENADK